MRTIINYYDRDVTDETQIKFARLIESTLIDCEATGRRLAKADRRYYTVERVPVQVTKINLQSQKPFLEEEDTAGYMSPASEAYWSM